MTGNEIKTGAELKKWVKSLGLKPEQMCVELGISISTLFKWFRSKELPRRATLSIAGLRSLVPDTATRQRSA